MVHGGFASGQKFSPCPLTGKCLGLGGVVGPAGMNNLISWGGAKMFSWIYSVGGVSSVGMSS